LPFPNSITGRYGSIGTNDYSQVVRKGVNYASGQPPLVAISRLNFSVPAGADAYDQPNLLALVSSTCGTAVQQADGLATALKTGGI
jgi:enamine deaminase RidA (YjgF/YER057c/UK114 family)